MSELTRLELLRRLFGQSLQAGVDVGIGDDAAVLAPSRQALVWTVDSAVDGVHFRRDWASLEDIGYRSTMAAASDLAAMGAAPRGALSALILPPDFSDDDLTELARGQAEAAAAIGTRVVGGNLARGAELSITTTLLGEAERPLLRSGARPGESVAIAGRLGLARAGMHALERGLGGTSVRAAIATWQRPRALIREGLFAAGHATAAIDVSDGLLLDAWRLSNESQIAIVLERDAVLLAGGAELLGAAEALSLDPLDLALRGGEDYALVMTFAPGDIAPPFLRIGSCEPGSGIFLSTAEGTRVPIDPRGFDHFG